MRYDKDSNSDFRQARVPDAKPRIDLGVIVPAGPGTQVEDTIDSVFVYGGDSHHTVIVNDTGGSLGHLVAPNVDVIEAPTDARGGQGGLWVKIAAGYTKLLSSYNPKIVLRIDTDALLIGHGLEKLAWARFRSQKDLGLLGAYRYGPDGLLRDFSPAAEIMRREIGLLGYRHPSLRNHLRTQLRAASPGYEFGEHALGGAYIHSGTCARALYENGYLSARSPRHSMLGEDHLMALAVRAAGYTIGDFSGPDEPMAVKWRGLPDSPQGLVDREKLVTHSIRSWNHMNEDEIRAQFRSLRNS